MKRKQMDGLKNSNNQKRVVPTIPLMMWNLCNSLVMTLQAFLRIAVKSTLTSNRHSKTANATKTVIRKTCSKIQGKTGGSWERKNKKIFKSRKK